MSEAASSNPSVTAVRSHPLLSRIDKFFHITERGSSFRCEILAGLTTFSTLSYILVVNPMIMSASGMDYGALITATAVVGAVFTVMMGLWTNYPLAMAPGMGVNALLAYQVCQGMHVPWQGALGLVFYSGVLFFILSVTGLRKLIIESFPSYFKKIVSVGIGFFLAYLGLKNSGILVANPRTMIGLGNFASAGVLLPFLGIAVTVVMTYWRVPAALMLSILFVSIIGLFLPGSHPHTTLTMLPSHFFDWPGSMGKVFLQLDFGYFWAHLNLCLPIVLAILFGDLFSAMATLLAVCGLAKLTDENGDLPKLQQALTADATAAMGAALLGTNTPVIYIESAAGAEQGGRTGFVSIIVAACYLIALFFTPVIAAVPAMATGPVLVVIGIFMAQGLGELKFAELSVAATFLVTMLLMVLTSASDGLALGFIICVLMHLLTRRAKEIKPAAYVLAGLFLLHYLFP